MFKREAPEGIRNQILGSLQNYETYIFNFVQETFGGLPGYTERWNNAEMSINRILDVVFAKKQVSTNQLTEYLLLVKEKYICGLTILQSQPNSNSEVWPGGKEYASSWNGFMSMIRQNAPQFRLDKSVEALPRDVENWKYEYLLRAE